MRTVITVIAALAVGAAVSVAATHAYLGKQLTLLSEDREAMAAELAKLQSGSREAADRAAYLEKYTQDLEADMALLQTQLAARPAMSAVPDAPATTLEQDLVQAMADFQQTGPPETALPNPDENRWRGRDASMTPEERAEREARMTQFMNERRERFETMMNDLYNRTTDPVGQQRIASIVEFTDYMSELRQQMRDAESDEVREQLEKQMDEARRTVGQLFTEQRDAMMSDVASKYGISDPQKQQAFIKELDSLRESSPFYGFGGGRGGDRGRGGWGGGGPGGGGRGG
ncbi:MAG: hypothetical protein KJ052_06515 [Candidatus Hydrogenedentes bacterium]|nr:hypothetical protein [Candidatus Hydrogenedentota bacterium]